MIWTKFRVTLWDFFEWLKVVCLYYWGPFFWIDMALLSKYFFRSPFLISKRFLQARGESNLYAYGETPLTTMALIARNCQITEGDFVIELGCGRGRACFWLNSFIGCKVKGIDYIPDFIRKAKEVGPSGATFECADFMQADLSEASVIYLYGTCLEDETIKALCKKFHKGTKIITVSYPLTDYSPEFEVIRSFPARFNWGETEIYLQKRL